MNWRDGTFPDALWHRERIQRDTSFKTSLIGHVALLWSWQSFDLITRNSFTIFWILRQSELICLERCQTQSIVWEQILSTFTQTSPSSSALIFISLTAVDGISVTVSLDRSILVDPWLRVIMLILERARCNGQKLRCTVVDVTDAFVHISQLMKIPVTTSVKGDNRLNWAYERKNLGHGKYLPSDVCSSFNTWEIVNHFTCNRNFQL